MVSMCSVRVRPQQRYGSCMVPPRMNPQPKLTGNRRRFGEVGEGRGHNGRLRVMLKWCTGRQRAVQVRSENIAAVKHEPGLGAFRASAIAYLGLGFVDHAHGFS